MLLGKIITKMVQRMCGGEAPVLCFNPGEVGGLEAKPHPRMGIFGVCEEVWMCPWKDFLFLVLIKPFLSRILPCLVLFLQPGPVPAGLERELHPPSRPTGIFSLIPQLPQNPGGSDTFLLPDLPLDAAELSCPSLPPGSTGHLTVDFLLQKSGV